jgi:hypothetical protein
VVSLVFVPACVGAARIGYCLYWTLLGLLTAAAMTAIAESECCSMEECFHILKD